MLWKLAKKDFLLNLMTFKFAVGTVLCVVLVAAFIPILMRDYQQRLEHYNEAVANNVVELRKVKVFKNITPTVYRSPRILSIFSEGVEKQIVNSVKIEVGSVPEVDVGSTETNPYLSIFPALSISLIFKIVMSIMALLVTCDAISREREEGTLKLILSGTIARYEVLLAKLLAKLVILLIPTTVSFMIGLVILEFYPTVDLVSTDWVLILLMFVTSLIFIAGMAHLGLLVSCLTRNAAVSMMLGVFFWVVLVVVIPNGSICLATHFQPIESPEKIDAQIKALWNKFEDELKDFERTLPGRGNVAEDLGAFGQDYVVICDKTCLQRGQMRFPFVVPLQIEYADKVFDIRRRYLKSLTKQKTFAGNLSRISPISLYENVMSTLSGTDLLSLQYFTDMVKTYRSNVIDYIRSKTGNFASPSYFTISKEGEWKELQERLKPGREAQNEADKQKARENFRKWKEKIKNSRHLNLQDFPRFVFKFEGVSKTIERIIRDLSMLIIFNILLFALTFLVFSRYDVR